VLEADAPVAHHQDEVRPVARDDLRLDAGELEEGVEMATLGGLLLGAGFAVGGY